MSLEVKIKKKLKEFTLESELNVETGCTGLMGPSGSGKSITLKCIAGVETAGILSSTFVFFHYQSL